MHASGTEAFNLFRVRESNFGIPSVGCVGRVTVGVMANGTGEPCSSSVSAVYFAVMTHGKAGLSVFASATTFYGLNSKIV